MQATTFAYDIESYPNCFLVTVKLIGAGREECVTWRVYEDRNEIEQIRLFFNDRTKWFAGYNNMHYDDQIINFLIASPGLAHVPAREAARIIKEQSNKVILGEDKTYKWVSNFGSIDLMRIIQVGENKKSLKMVAVNLKWPKIQELPFPDYMEIRPEDLDTLIEYNINDVLITEALFHNLRDAVNTRSQVSFTYGVNVMSESKSGIGNVVFEQLYARATRQHPKQFRDLRSEKYTTSFEKILSPKVHFRSLEMQEFLGYLKTLTVARDDEWEEKVTIGKTSYTIARGGIHSNNEPAIYEASEGVEIIDADVDSYYPSIVVQEKIYPEHLSPMFCQVMDTMMKDRLEAKRSRDVAKADALKIAINGAFGKFGFQHHWMHDPDALYAVTLNGQLYLLMLIERLEEEGIPVFYANTDGITCEVEAEKKEVYQRICKAWSDYTGFSLSFTGFSKFIIRDVNAYLVVKTDGKLKRKGAMNKDLHIEDLMKGFKHPVVARAVEEYLLNGIPLEDTIRACDDLYDFCLAQKVGSNFSGVFFQDHTGRYPLQRANRYLVVESGGGVIYKEGTDPKRKGAKRRISLVAKEYVVLANDMAEVEEAARKGDLRVKHAYYERLARDLVRQFEPSPDPQLGLFEGL